VTADRWCKSPQRTPRGAPGAVCSCFAGPPKKAGAEKGIGAKNAFEAAGKGGGGKGARDQEDRERGAGGEAEEPGEAANKLGEAIEDPPSGDDDDD